MRRSGALSLVFVVVVALGSLAATLVSGSSPELGLDLQGGASVVLQPTDDVEDGQLDQAIEIIRSRVDALGVAEPDIARQGDSIIIQLPGVKDQRRALEVVGRTAELRFRPVVSAFAPGSTPPAPTATVPVDPTATTVPVDPTATTLPTDATASTTPPNSLPPNSSTTGVPTTTTGGDEQGLSSGAGLVEGEMAAPLQTDPSTTTAVPATTTAVPSSTTASTAPADTSTTAPGSPPEGTTDDATDPLAAACGGVDAEDDDPAETVILPGRDDNEDGQPDSCYQLGPVPTASDDGRLLVGSAIDSAQAVIPQTEWIVNLECTGSGLSLFNQVAQECFNYAPTCPQRQIAITLDGRVESAPSIQPEDTVFEPFGRDGVSISGGSGGSGFNEGDAKDLALVLRYGALPVQLEPQTVQTVSATLGRDSLNAGLIAGLGGVALVALYMILYYRALGLVVVVGLALWAALSYSIVSYLGEHAGLALSLSGVTGIVVSVGVTVDSYVVYFERLKDEIRSGKKIRKSVDRGFKRAFRTILAADTSAFIGAAMLYFLTVGPVRGFAFFLGLSTLLDVVIAYMFTRPLVALLGRSRFFTEARYVGVARGLGVRGSAPALPAVAGGSQ
ncbi:protein translocase subunit SecD [soil metagenome]